MPTIGNSPSKFIIHTPKKTIFIKQEERVIYRDWKTDSAVILFLKGDLQLPESPVALLPMGTLIDIGAEVGWLGFPSVAPHNLCFFSGNVSARQEFRNAYLIDGVAINGVSGGPVLHLTGTEGVQIVGTVSALVLIEQLAKHCPDLLSLKMFRIFMMSQTMSIQ